MHRKNPPGPHLNRRGLLTAAAAVGLAAGAAGPGSAAAAGPPPGGRDPETFGPAQVRPGDPRYESLLRGDNHRFVGHPDEVQVVGSTAQVVQAVQDAVRAGKRIGVRSGGHCFENFTADPEIRLLLDLSQLDAVGYDPSRRAFEVQPGATLGRVYRTLFKGWGVTIPAGGCPEVGAGGHLVGGGYGPLSRRYGSVVDHLYGVEVVVVDRDGNARAVVATREPDDPNRDLWWAHTGGGGGNFGVVTRYWLRSPDADADADTDADTGAAAADARAAAAPDPRRLLPPAPAEILEALVEWTWDPEKTTEQAVTTLIRNFCTWHEQHSDPAPPYDALYAILQLAHQDAGSFSMVVQIDAGVPHAADLVDEFVAHVNAGTGLTPDGGSATAPWLYVMTWPGNGESGNIITRRYKGKAGYLKRSFTDTQLATIHRHLTNTTGSAECGMLIVGYGGRVRAVRPDATAVAQRDVVMKAVYHSIWADESDDAARLSWVRELYRDVYRDTGGVPVPGEVSDGSYINYPDTDLADPAWNTSGTPWHTLYYKDNYPRLQRVKARWDPRDVFRHALSIELPR
ncbi:FAD-binding oxidoreductase [Kitasatospora sp. CB01950]|uniref:FAD-binding oxidoreductase n=1 Tax=Kitasatospora sp. CB01950 TaxID=1703930 RepID=UPI000938FE19|nr:FAD-binding protein [Kitasatospora sp. CB01950]OKJ13757.1 FAD-linked oxidase [Kitasatospora sp. CB01950]